MWDDYKELIKSRRRRHQEHRRAGRRARSPPRFPRGVRRRRLSVGAPRRRRHRVLRDRPRLAAEGPDGHAGGHVRGVRPGRAGVIDRRRARRGAARRPRRGPGPSCPRVGGAGSPCGATRARDACDGPHARDTRRAGRRARARCARRRLGAIATPPGARLDRCGTTRCIRGVPTRCATPRRCVRDTHQGAARRAPSCRRSRSARRASYDPRDAHLRDRRAHPARPARPRARPHGLPQRVPGVAAGGRLPGRLPPASASSVDGVELDAVDRARSGSRSS